ncbi:MAG: FAD binding domain-containing protein [Desulfarculaceae bacterium]|nr:FAD binding domain-containing protein [Desulfarculaceae bacterium]MCF8074432.1 FAD binding domain-containing protein [Desulfarculaceae bacterium]MCF8102728.1 FAD binding domain-containing protein [Desulfarculaceae bacterium]MCF8116417.1 FAD binding domain-containing protein [Desulfarculaceae bacterium]
MALAFEKLHWHSKLEVAEYLVPASLTEALDMLASHGGKARVIAGGTDVIPELRSRKLDVSVLVDVSRLPDMDGIEADGDDIVIGGGVTHAAAAASPLIQDKASALATGCGWVGSPQIRNVATLAGNLVSGQPAADASVPLLALDAEVTIASAKGERVVPLSEFFLGLGQTALDPGREILTSIRFQALADNQGSAYLRLAKRKALNLPILVCAVKATADGGNIASAAIALGPVAPVPFRERAAEEFVAGKPATMETLTQAGETATATCNPRDSLLRGSCDYRTEMVKVFVRRGLTAALAQAGCTVK